MTRHRLRLAAVLVIASATGGCGTPKEKTAPCKRPANLSSYAEARAECGPMTWVNADPTAGHLSAGLVHLANIGHRTGRVLHFDPEKEAILDDAEANAMLKRKYRKHWGAPKVA